MQFLLNDDLQHNSWREVIDEVYEATCLTPYADVTVHFLESISKNILLDKEMRSYPEIMATAYWLRKSNIMQIGLRYNKYAEGRVILPRGTVLHYAPSNVDSIFIYSWILSLLMGNKNVVRLSRKRTEQMDVLLRKINQLLDLKEFQEIKKRTLLVSYEHEVEYTRYLSDHCQLRVIWGGDQTVQAIRAVPLSPIATEMVFPDRFSKAFFEASAILDCNESDMEVLTKNFYNDSFWFGQMACSSPRELYWVGGEAEIEKAKLKFWTRMEERVVKESYENSLAVSMLQLTTAHYYAAQSYTSKVRVSPLKTPIRVELSAYSEDIRERHCGGGLFLEKNVVHIRETLTTLTQKDQTVSYFGFGRAVMLEWAKSITNRAIDRIVPVGKALEFHSLWDGYDFFVYFTRELYVE
jgi:hypothetical protein